jgi:hypothetical protein
MLFGRDLLAEAYGSTVGWLLSLDSDAQANEEGISSFRFGVGISPPSGIEVDEGTPECVIVFSKGYYSPSL